MKYGWIKDKHDPRDFSYRVDKPIPLPPVVDLRNNYSHIYDQGELGSCTANAIAVAIDFERVKQAKQPILPSRLFIYYNERNIEGTVHEDSGAQIRDGIKSVATLGACPEKEWPYVISHFTKRPSSRCFSDAHRNLVEQYLRLDNTKLDDLKHCLASGYGFVFGFTVFEDFESDLVASTGIVPMPHGQSLGGHAVFAVGYDDNKQAFIVRNSWGPDWGDKGHFYLPYNYITDSQLADDFWSIRLVL